MTELLSNVETQKDKPVSGRSQDQSSGPNQLSGNVLNSGKAPVAGLAK